jgi:hypothetical protein
LRQLLQFHQNAGGILQIEHRDAEHFPVGVARMRIIGVFDAPGIALVESVFDLQGYFRIGEIGQVAELALGDAANRIGHHKSELLEINSTRRPSPNNPTYRSMRS